jgi:hypothetical protein
MMNVLPTMERRQKKVILGTNGIEKPDFPFAEDIFAVRYAGV